jgi:hypothetical protein
MTQPSHEFTRGLYGWITHTAWRVKTHTREWCESVEEGSRVLTTRRS